jgi:hypothetical protein
MACVKPKAKFDVIRLKDRPGWYSRPTLPGGRQPQIDDFKTQAEARKWIKAQSTAWLKMYEGGRYA